MPKLHEQLAVYDNIKSQATVVAKTQMATFTSKPHLFTEVYKEYQPSEPGMPVEKVEQLSLQSKVREEYDHIRKIVAKAIDVGYQIDIANGRTAADIVLEDGTIIAKDVPATALLQLEHRITEIQQLVKTTPTLDPAKSFKPDPDRGFGIYKAREILKNVTKKTDTPVVLYPATKEHPAQVQLKSYDLPVGKVLEQEWSSLVTPATKAEILDRLDQLLRGVKQARAKANNLDIAEIVQMRIGKTMLDYAFAPFLSFGTDEA